MLLYTQFEYSSYTTYSHLLNLIVVVSILYMIKLDQNNISQLILGPMQMKLQTNKM